MTTWGGNNKRNWRDSILNGKLQTQTHLITHKGEKSKKYTVEESETIEASNKNIARGTTDPEIDSVTWIELGNNMAPLTLVTNLTT